MYEYDIEVIRGETYDNDIKFEAGTSSISLEGKTAKAQVRPSKGSSTLSAEFYCTVDTESGLIHINLSSDQTEDLTAGEYAYDVWLLGTGFRKCYIGGKFFARERVTVIESETVDISVTIIWNDDSDSRESRPAAQMVSLLANGVTAAQHSVSGTGNTWTYTFADMPAAVNGSPITYTIAAEDVEGYLTDVDGYTITNEYEEE